MKFWILVFGIAYAALLIFASLKSYKKGRSVEDFMMAGSSIGILLGVLTYAAALFSTFTFLGMPDFFRRHGIGAWIFLAVSDGAMVFFILWFGYHIRMKVKQLGFKGVAGMISKCYGNKWAGYTIFLTAFLFLIPYVGIQIQGISIFMGAAFPDFIPSWGWAVGIVIVMLVYSEIGGLKAIVYSDAIQGVLLLTVLWIIGYNCLNAFGGVAAMFDKIEVDNVALLSTPGPEGLFSAQFFIASMIAIVMIPVTQPQLTTRLVVMKSMKSMHLMAVAVGAFAILVITPTIFIGMYGASFLKDTLVDLPIAQQAGVFFKETFLYRQPNFVAALALVGLIAAGLSTTNAQIFALGSEIRGLLNLEEKKVMRITKFSIFIFALIALVFSELIKDQIAMLARVSFAGTALMGPMILLGILSNRKVSTFIILASFAALVIFLLSLGGIIPGSYFGLRLDLTLFVSLSVVALISYGMGKK
ncbi:MAG: sodium:solute symporter family protein [Cyclobacteriaceae bacterium]|nr:sodium:solute symporter family protein [Cyclobacteriaceae bacterium]MCK5470824.1 sodium:solute symporter family protein [Cyclobacteriaceae bacterium]